MGSIFSHRRQKSTIEVLQDIEKEIDDLETNQADKEFNRRRFIGYLIIASVSLLIGLLAYWYVYLFPPSGLTWRHYLICLPLISMYSASVWVLKWGICWWYEQSLSLDERKLHRLRRRKRDILDSVKDRETYKVAKEILERFDPQVRQEKAAKKAREFQQQLAMIKRFASLEGSALTTPSPDSQLRNRIRPKSRPPSPSFRERDISANIAASIANIPHADSASSIHPPPPQPRETSLVPVPPLSRMREMTGSGPVIERMIHSTPTTRRDPPTQVPLMAASFAQPAMAAIPMPVCLPRPMIPRERSAFDRMIDFLLGEGPSNRYALICHHCRSHNGMALKEEVETMAFRCCYCFTFNPARKLALPVGPQEPDTSTMDHPLDDRNEVPLAETPSPSEREAELSRRDSAIVGSPLPKLGISRSRAPSRSSTTSRESTQSAPL